MPRSPAQQSINLSPLKYRPEDIPTSSAILKILENPANPDSDNKAVLRAPSRPFAEKKVFTKN